MVTLYLGFATASFCKGNSSSSQSYFGAPGVRPFGEVPAGLAESVALAASALRPGGMLGIDSGGGCTSAGLQPVINSAKLKSAVAEKQRSMMYGSNSDGIL
jgi:hypothetical protein